MKILIVIPARGGSKGIPRKNIKLLNDKPLIYYTIDAARCVASDDDICITTDDDEIIDVVESYGLRVPFKRPDYLASDTSGSYEVLLHALDFYESKGLRYDAIVLLQPTSPFRTGFHVKEALALYDSSVDMVVSVKLAEVNPYYDCYEDDGNGYLIISKGDDSYTRRQDCPSVYQYNGAIYIINPESLKQTSMSNFSKKRKFIMDREHSMDLDTMFDWYVAEMMLEKRIIQL